MVQETTSKTSCGSVYREESIRYGWMGLRRTKSPRKRSRSIDGKGDGRAGVGSERCTGTTEQSNPPVRAYYERHAGQPLEMRCEM